MRYIRPKADKLEAVQWDGTNSFEVEAFALRVDGSITMVSEEDIVIVYPCKHCGDEFEDSTFKVLMSPTDVAYIDNGVVFVIAYSEFTKLFEVVE